MKQNIINRFRQFLGEVNIESRKVVWPNRKELITSTTVVIVTVVLVALFIGVVDFILSRLIGIIIR